MNKVISLLCISFVFGLFGQFAFAGPAETSEMAKIVYNLNHYPTDADKKVLNKIIKSGSQDKQQVVLAQAISNLNHSVDPDDEASLKMLLNDETADQDEKDLANILLNIDHRPSNSDKTRLKAMMK